MWSELAAGLWTTDRSLRFVVEIGTRMTCIRLDDGGLFVHSPVHLDEGLRKTVDEHGPVKAVVAPNRFHHLYVGEWAAGYPQASLYAAPGLAQKRADVRFDGELGEEAPPEWAGQIDQIPFAGMPLSNEVAFFHRASRTLLLTDLVFNVREEARFTTRVGWKLMGAYGRFGPSRLEKLIMRDRPAGRRSIERILEWDFDRVIMAHGEVLESGGREALRAGYDWLLA